MFGKATDRPVNALIQHPQNRLDASIAKLAGRPNCCFTGLGAESLEEQEVFFILLTKGLVCTGVGYVWPCTKAGP